MAPSKQWVTCPHCEFKTHILHQHCGACNTDLWKGTSLRAQHSTPTQSPKTPKPQLTPSPQHAPRPQTRRWGKTRYYDAHEPSYTQEEWDQWNAGTWKPHARPHGPPQSAAEKPPQAPPQHPSNACEKDEATALITTLKEQHKVVAAVIQSLEEHTGPLAAEKKAEAQKELKEIQHKITACKPPDEQIAVLEAVVDRKTTAIDKINGKIHELNLQRCKLEYDRDELQNEVDETLLKLEEIKNAVAQTAASQRAATATGMVPKDEIYGHFMQMQNMAKALAPDSALQAGAMLNEAYAKLQPLFDGLQKAAEAKPDIAVAAATVADDGYSVAPSPQPVEVQSPLRVSTPATGVPTPKPKREAPALFKTKPPKPPPPLPTAIPPITPTTMKLPTTASAPSGTPAQHRAQSLAPKANDGMVTPPVKPRIASPKPMGDTVKLDDGESPFVFGERGTPPDAVQFPDITTAASMPIPAMGSSLAANAGKRPTVSRPPSPDASNHWFGETPRKKVSRPNSRASSQAPSESRTTEQSIPTSQHPSRRASRAPSQARGRPSYTLQDKKVSNGPNPRSASATSCKSAKSTINRMEREKVLNEVHHKELTQKLEDVLDKRRAAREQAKLAKAAVAAATAKAVSAVQ